MNRCIRTLQTHTKNHYHIFFYGFCKGIEENKNNKVHIRIVWLQTINKGNFTKLHIKIKINKDCWIYDFIFLYYFFCFLGFGKTLEHACKKYPRTSPCIVSPFVFSKLRRYWTKHYFRWVVVFSNCVFFQLRSCFLLLFRESFLYVLKGNLPFCIFKFYLGFGEFQN